MSQEPIILMDPHPRPIDLIFSNEDKRRLEALGHVVWHQGAPAPDEHIDKHLPQTVALVGQTPMPRHRLDRAPHLRVIANVEGNFKQNIDYDECHRRNIAVLTCAPAFAPAVAELALSMALALARGIVDHDAAFRRGEETYSAASNTSSVLLRGRTFGLLGCGNVGRALLPLLRPFTGSILVHDPWLHNRVVEATGVEPVNLDALLRRSDVLFLLSAATTENQHLLGREQFDKLRRGSAVVLVSRAEVVDFDALLDAAESGHIRAAIDVYPEEPVPADARVRQTPNIILSGHRAGGLPETYREIGRMVADDLELVLGGLPPQRMQRAQIETIRRYQGKPIGVGPRK